MLLGTLAARFFGNLLPGKPKIPGRKVIRADEETIRSGEGTIRPGEDF